MNQYKLPFLNPIRFHQIGIGDFAYNNIPSFEYKRGYNQIYHFGDRPYIQILSTAINPFMKMDLIDLNGNISWTWLPWNTSIAYGSYFLSVWHNYFPDTIAEGIYFLKLEISDADGSIFFYSEPINLLTTSEDTVRIEYTHDQNEFDSIFVSLDNPSYLMPFMLRIEGGMKSEGLLPGGKYTMFQDQDYQSIVLQSQPYNVEKFVFGPPYGMPNHLADKINRIFGLSNVKINGIGYSRNEGAKLERNGEPGYPLAGWSLDLVKSLNPYSESFEVAPVIPFLCNNEDILCSNETILLNQENI